MFVIAPPPPTSDLKERLLRGILFSLLGIILSIFIPLSVPQATASVDQVLIKKVESYYDINKNKSNRNYGCKWYRTLVAFGYDNIPNYVGPDGSCSMTAYTATEAKKEEEVWSGWTPVREELEKIEESQTVTVDPPKAQRSSQQNQKIVSFKPGTIFFSYPPSGEQGCIVDLADRPHGSNGYSLQAREGFDDIMCVIEVSNYTNWQGSHKNFDIKISVKYPDGTKKTFTDNFAPSGVTSNDLFRLGPDFIDDNKDNNAQATNYQIELEIVASSDYTIGTRNKVTLTVIDDEPKPKVSVSAPDITEGDELTVTLTADRTAFKPYDVDVEITNRTVINDERKEQDIVVEKTYNATINKNATTTTFKVPTIDDLVDYNPDKNAQIGAQIVDGDDYDLGSPQWILIDVADSNKKKQITATVTMPASITEGDGGTQTDIQPNPTITLSETVSNNVIFRIKGLETKGEARPTNFSSGNPIWSDGSANPDWDYAFNSGVFHTGYTRSVTKGDTSVSLGNIKIHNDDLYEGDETIGLDVTCEAGCSGPGYEITIDNFTRTEIIDNDQKPTITLVMPDDIEEGNTGGDKAIYPKLVLSKPLRNSTEICMKGIDNSPSDKWAKPGNGSDSLRDYAFNSGVWNSNTALCSTIPTGITEYSNSNSGYKYRINIKPDTDAEDSELIGVKIFCKPNTDCSGFDIIQDNTPTRILNDDQPNIKIRYKDNNISEYCRQDFPLSNLKSGRNIRTKSFCIDNNWKYERETIRDAALNGSFNGVDLNPGLQDIVKRTWGMIATKSDRSLYSTNGIDSGLVRKHYYRNKSKWSGEEHIRLYRYIYTTLGYLEGGSIALFGNTGNFSAEQCVKDFNSLKKSVACGVGGHRVMIGMPDKTTEDNLYAWIYPSTGATENTKIRITKTNVDKVTDKETWDILVPPEGIKHTFDDNTIDERDRNFEFLFEVVGGTNWTINQPDTRKTVFVVDNDPTIMEWTANTLTEKLDEGGFQRIAKLSLVKGNHTEADDDHKDFWQANDTMTWDFNLGGDINLVNTPPDNCLNASDKVTCNKSTENGGVAESTIPVFIDLDNSKANSRSKRLSLDSFELTGRTVLGSGWVMQMKVGEDVNDVDENLTTDLQITLSQSGGKVIVNNLPSSFTIYDDEKVSHIVEDNSNLTDDNIYVSFTTDKYQVLEDNGPGQPVINYYNKDNDGNKTRQTTLINTTEIFVKVDKDSSTAKVGPASEFYNKANKHHDFFLDELTGILLVPGEGIETGKFDVRLNTQDDDGVLEYKCSLPNYYTEQEKIDNCVGIGSGNETIELYMDPTTLPEGIKIDPNGHSSTTITIVNSERDVIAAEKAQVEVNRCDPNHDDYDATADCNKPVLEITGLTKYTVNENQFSNSNWVRAKVKNKSTKKAFSGDVLYKLEGSCVRRRQNQPPDTMNFKINKSIGKNGTVDEWMLANTSGNRYIISPGFFNKGDNPSCDLTLSLRPSSEYIVQGSSKTLHIADTDETKVSISKYPDAAIEDYDTDSTDPHIKVWLTTEIFSGNTYAGENHRAMKPGEIIEFPIKAMVDGGVISTDKYKLSLVESQSNVEVRPLSDNSGYAVKITGTSSTALTTDTYDKCYGGTTSSNRTDKWKSVNHVVCLNIQTTLDVDEKSTEDIEFVIDYTDKSFGDTDVDGGFGKPQGTGGNKSITASVSVKGFETAVGTQSSTQQEGKILTLHTRQTKIEEPDGNPNITSSLEQPWTDIPLDVVMKPGPSPTGATGFKFCVLKDDTTSSYYYDWRIVDANDHAYGVAVGGFAWNPVEGCTKGSVRASMKERYYLRVHGDFHDEGEEKIALYLKVSSTNDNVTSGTDKTNPITFTITNDGPLPRNYLSYLGHSMAAETVSIIESRMSADRPIVNTNFPSIKFGAMPTEENPITDPDELLEGSSVDYTNPNGFSFYTRYSVSNFSTDMLSGENKHLTFGADKNIRNNPKWNYGAMIMSTTNKGRYGSDYTIDSEMLALIPYLIYNQRYYGALGFGKGDYKHLMDTEEVNTDTSWKFVSLGGKQQVFQFNDKTSIYLTGDYFHQKIESDKVDGLNGSSSSSYRSRVGFLIDHKISDHILISPSMHYRKEGGDITTDKGIELGFAVDYKDGPWNVNAHYVKTIEMDNEWDSRSFSVSFTQGRTRTYMNTDGERTSYGVGHQVTDQASIAVDASEDESVNGNVEVSW